MSAKTDWQSYQKHPLFSCIQCRSLSASRGRTIASEPMLVREQRSELIASETSCSSMSNAQITIESNGRSEIGFLGWLKDASYFDVEYPPCQIDRCGETAWIQRHLLNDFLHHYTLVKGQRHYLNPTTSSEQLPPLYRYTLYLTLFIRVRRLRPIGDRIDVMMEIVSTAVITVHEAVVAGLEYPTNQIDSLCELHQSARRSEPITRAARIANKARRTKCERSKLIAIVSSRLLVKWAECERGEGNRARAKWAASRLQATRKRAEREQSDLLRAEPRWLRAEQGESKRADCKHSVQT